MRGKKSGSPPQPKLTRRERDVLEQLLRGRCDKGIREALGIGHGAVRRHITSLLRKYGVASRLELCVAFLERPCSNMSAAIMPR